MSTYRKGALPFVAMAILSILCPAYGESESGGTIKGIVTIDGTKYAVHAATVLIVQLGRVTDTAADGSYVFRQVPPGTYDVVVHSPALADGRETIQASEGKTTTADFQLKLATLRSQITVTASGSAQTTLEAFQAVTSMDAIDLAGKAEPSLGDVLKNESGVAKRSFGPGNARPVIRGFGWYGKKAYLRLGYNYDNRRYGIPFAARLESGGDVTPEEETANLRLKLNTFRFSGGFRDLESAINGIRVIVGYTSYSHGEYDSNTLGTLFTNKQWTYRIAFDQRKQGVLSGNFGISGLHRDYHAIGAEALAPPTLQNNHAFFGLETFDFQKVAFQRGGRFERNAYNPDASFSPARPARSFNGFSGAAGIRVPLWKGGAFITNYTHAFRAPALEELYNDGPHPGNLAYEIGNSELKWERCDGIDLSLRHQSGRLRAEANIFDYYLEDFVFLAPTGNVVDNLREAKYLQGDSRYLGGEASLDIKLHERIWFNTGMDIVDAKLINGNTPLPRIPPLRGRAGVEFRHRRFCIKPEAVMAHSQNKVFPTETRTGGYTVFNINASYTIPRQHEVHVFSVDTFNLGDRLYRNHLSFIKDLAPEVGRGVRFSYTIRFY